MTEPHPTAGYDTEAHTHQVGDPDTSTVDRSVVLRRLCVFELDLTCGHCVSVSVNGWYPVIPVHPWQQGSAGRFPARVGGPIPDPLKATS